jgi:signal transduction histidine kinase
MDPGSITPPIALNPVIRGHEGAMLLALLQATDEGILLTGLDRQDILANRRLGELFDMLPEQIVEEQPDAVRRALHVRLRDPDAFDMRMAETYADPSATYTDDVELTGETQRILRRFTSPVLDTDGNPIARLWTFLDVTESRLLEQMREQELARRTRDYLATSQVLEAISTMSRLAVQSYSTEALLDGVIDALGPVVSSQSLAILLADSQGVAGRVRNAGGAFRTTRISANRMDALSAIAAHVPGGGYHEELGYRLGAVIPLIADDKDLGLLVVDDTPASDADEHLYRAHLAGLAAQVAIAVQTHRWKVELTGALDALRAAQDAMVETEKLRMAGLLAASIAHDVKNIVSALQLDLMMTGDPLSETVAVHLNRFSTLSHQLLALARPGKISLDPVDIEDLIAHVVPLIAGQAEVYRVEISVLVDAGRPHALIDRSQLEHLLVNLCLNAIQAMSARGGRIDIAARRSGGAVEIEVSDTGCGIPADQLERIFEPFYTTRANGIGLGLFSCRRIAESYGGKLGVSSTVGEGTVFKVSLPSALSE